MVSFRRSLHAPIKRSYFHNKSPAFSYLTWSKLVSRSECLRFASPSLDAFFAVGPAFIAVPTVRQMLTSMRRPILAATASCRHRTCHRRPLSTLVVRRGLCGVRPSRAGEAELGIA